MQHMFELQKVVNFWQCQKKTFSKKTRKLIVQNEIQPIKLDVHADHIVENWIACKLFLSKHAPAGVP